MDRKAEVVEVMGRRWDTTRPSFFAAPTGLSLFDIVKQSIDMAYKDKVYNKTQYLVLSKYARVRLNGVEKDRRYWKEIFPEKGDRIEVLHGVRGGGGGGGKNPLATILSAVIAVVAMVASVFVPPAGVTLWGVLISQGAMQLGIGLVAMGMIMAVNALFPAATPSLSGLGAANNEKTSQTYTLTGGHNTHNINGYVPLVLGRHKLTPPLGAKSWTVWEGEKQFFNMLVVWGHPDIEVTDFKIGDTELSKFHDIEHNFIQSTTGNNLKYFAKQYNEQSVGSVLAHSEGWIQRTVGEANDLSVDIMFQSGLVSINQKNGNYEDREVWFLVEYKKTSGDNWQGFPATINRWFGAATLKWTEREMLDKLDVYWVDTGTYACTLGTVRATRNVSSHLLAVKRGTAVSYNGQVKLWPTPATSGWNSNSGMAYFNCSVSCTLNISGGSSGYWAVHSTRLTGSARDFVVTLSSGAFKWNGRVYRVSDSISATPADGFNPCSIWVTKSGNVQKNSGDLQLYPKRASGISGGNIGWGYNYYVSSVEYDEWGGSFYGYTANGVMASVDSGTAVIESIGEACFKNNKQKQLVYNLKVEGLELDTYDVRIKRTTGDSSDSYIVDEAAWSTMRAIIDQPAFDTPVPICVSELRIRASEQLSGYVDDFNAICTSTFPDWDETAQAWIAQDLDEAATAQQGKNVYIKRKTRNPASILRYLLTSRHSLNKPFSLSRVDNTSLVALWRWCKENEFYFDFVCDSEEALWQRLVKVLAPAKAAPTTDVDGLWGAIIDTPDKVVKQLFTPRNSWGMTVQRGFAKIPDALRVSFIDEEDDWTQKEGFVYNDGFNKDGSDGMQKADDVVEWDFPGVTNWGRMWKLGRYHLAQMLHRQMTVTISTDWEWIAVHRGDLVGLSSDVLMNTFGTARVIRWAYRIDNRYIDDTRSDLISESVADLVDDASTIITVDSEADIPLDGNGNPLDPIGIEIDDTVIFSEGGDNNPVRYGIAIRSSETAAVTIIELKPAYGEEHSILFFANIVKHANKPPLGSLVSVSLLGSEYEEYLVASITPGDNLSAQIELVPWKTKEIRAATSGEIPEYEAPIVLDVVRSTTLPTPMITSVASDESTLLLTDSGNVVIRIGAYWQLPPSTTGLAYYTVQMICTNKNTGEELVGTATNADAFVAVEGVRMKEVYYCKLRVTDPMSGRTSGWSNIVQHTVQGPINLPPAPQNVRAQAAYPDGIKLSWDEVEVLDLDHYRPEGPGISKKARTKGKETEYFAPAQGVTGAVTYSVYSVDILNLESAKAGSVIFRVFGPKVVEITSAVLKNDGIEVIYSPAEGTWPVESYEFTCLDRTGSSSTLMCVVPHPDEFVRGTTVSGRAKDVYGSWGETSGGFEVEIIPPLTPEVEIGVNENGTAVFEWQNCRTVTDIRHYRLEGASQGSTTALHVVLNVDKIIWEKVDEDGNPDANGQYRRGALTEYVTAVDKWGFESQRGGKTFIVWPPYNPVLQLKTHTDGLYLEWQDCKRTFLIERYDVQDCAENGDVLNLYSQQANSIRLKPRTAGNYLFKVQAFDVIKSESSLMELAATIIGVEDFTPSAKVDGGDVLIEWPMPNSSFPVQTYRICDAVGAERNRLLGTADTTFFRIPAPKAETAEISWADGPGHYVRTYYVQGEDSAENMSGWCRADVTIGLPAEPNVSVKLSADGITIEWAAGDAPNTLPVAAWDVVRWYTDGNGAAQEEDYGRLDVTSLTVDAVTTGTHWFEVRPVDSAGNIGPWGECEFEASPPGRVAFDSCYTIDNNVMLYWSEPDKIFFPIEYYLLESDLGQGDGLFAEIGRIDARFACSFESQSGNYVYRVTPVDVAGNAGTSSLIRMSVAQPPDFVLYFENHSLFNGGNYGSSAQHTGKYASDAGLDGMVLDGVGHMIGPYSNATWNENLAEMASQKGVQADNITWANKANWGWEHWLDPATAEASYVEYIDVGATVPSTKITVTASYEQISANTSTDIAIKIETSLDGSTWVESIDDADNGVQVYATSFRYIRETVTFTGAPVAVSDIYTVLNVKLESDSGMIDVYASNTTVDGETVYANDPAWTSMAATPMLTGQWVPFNRQFVDVQSITANVVSVKKSGGADADVAANVGVTAHLVFVDVKNPTGFRVFCLDKNGNRASATVSWEASGVTGFNA